MINEERQLFILGARSIKDNPDPLNQNVLLRAVKGGGVLNTSTEELPSSAIVLYPNPVEQELIVQLDRNLISKPLMYRIDNVLGQTVQSGQLETSNNSIQIAPLPPGNYWLHLNDDSGQHLIRPFQKM